MALFGTPMVWFAYAIFGLPFAIVLGAFFLGTSGLLHVRMKNDWRASDTMNIEQFERQHAVGRNITVKKK